jgi:hypothetical protein
MTSTSPGAAKAFEAAELAIRANFGGPAPAPPAWLRAALTLHRNTLGLDAIAAALREAGHPPEAVELAVAAVRSDVRRLGLFWSRMATK